MLHGHACCSSSDEVYLRSFSYAKTRHVKSCEQFCLKLSAYNGRLGDQHCSHAQLNMQHHMYSWYTNFIKQLMVLMHHSLHALDICCLCKTAAFQKNYFDEVGGTQLES